jgi:hypothetical protein
VAREQAGAQLCLLGGRHAGSWAGMQDKGPDLTDPAGGEGEGEAPSES